MPELTRQTLIEKIGEELYSVLDKEANKEVAMAMAMPLVDKYRQERYYRKRQLLTILVKELEAFENFGLKISPIEIVYILFYSKLLFAAQSEQEYMQRSGGGMWFADDAFRFFWEERNGGIDAVVDEHLRRLGSSITEGTLISEIKHFDTPEGLGNPTTFFRDLFSKLELPFHAFFNNADLIENYRQAQPNLRAYTAEDARRYFCAPSMGVSVVGSPGYIHLYGSAWLRTYLSMLRIASFIYKPQIDFGFEIKDALALTTPVLLGSNSFGGFSWDEDTKRPWEKTPDGCLFLSFGYRGISKMWIDSRSFAGIEKFFTTHRIIFEKLKNPWDKISINDIAPSIDLLSSAVQMMDLGAKILLIYCCLEHMFVPEGIRKDNVKYIIGGINALRPEMLPWFERFYQARCDYAHKGFVFKDDKTLSLVFESVQNTFSLLTTKLGNR